jgi:hypothetical protein
LHAGRGKQKLVGKTIRAPICACSIFLVPHLRESHHTQAMAQKNPGTLTN